VLSYAQGSSYVGNVGSCRIWPAAFRTVGGMIRGGVVVRVGCADCGHFFDVDLPAIARRRGADFTLLDRHCACRLTHCRGVAYFVAAPSMTAILTTLVDREPDPLKLNGMRAADLEPPTPPRPNNRTQAVNSLRGFVHQIEKRTATG